MIDHRLPEEYQDLRKTVEDFAHNEVAPVIGEFCNELLDQQLRLALSREAGPIREILFAQAFAEGNLLDPQRDEGDYQSDPLGIGRCR